MTVCSTRNRYAFNSWPVRTVLHSTEPLSQMGPKIWEIVPNDMKDLSTLTAFKKVIKQWRPHACPCRLCRTCIYQVGFTKTFECKINLFCTVSFISRDIQFLTFCTYAVRTLFIAILFIFLYFF